MMVAMATDTNDAPNSDSTDAEAVLIDTHDGVATITLNLPERKNSLAPELVNLLAQRIEAANNDDSVRVIILTNTGNTFCAGADLKSSRPGISEPKGLSFADVFTMIMRGPKPVIGRIDGHATGGGVGLVSVCDISVMRDDAKFGFTEARLGVAPAIISVVCLPKMRRADASELFLTAERITPARAVEVGLVNDAVPADEIDARVDHYIDMIVRGGPLALAACKRIINDVPAMGIDEGLVEMTKQSGELFRTEEAQAGIAAFVARETAPWVPEGRR